MFSGTETFQRENRRDSLKAKYELGVQNHVRFTPKIQHVSDDRQHHFHFQACSLC